jgi:hypothetical protein
MKILSLLLGSWILTTICVAQEASVKPAKPASLMQGLTENVTIHVRGVPSADGIINIQLSGVGPEFHYHGFQPQTNSEPMIVKLEATLSSADEGKLLVQYLVGASIPVQIGFVAGGGRATQYKDSALTGRVLVAYGEEVKLASINGKDCVLTVTKYGGSKK